MFAVFILLDVALATQFSVGEFSVKISADYAVSIVHACCPSRVQWASVSPIAAAVMRYDVKEVSGNYNITEVEETICNDVVFHSVQHYDGHNVSLSGLLCDGEAEATLTFAVSGDPNLLNFHASVAGAQLNNVRLVYSTSSEEHFVGFGHQYSHLNMKGLRLPVFSTEQGVGRGLAPITSYINKYGGFGGGSPTTTYTAVPQYISSHLRGLFLENTEYSVFDMTGDNEVVVSVNHTVMRGRIIAGATPKSLLSAYSSWAGRMRPLPRWIGQGAVLGVTGGTSSVMDRLDTLLRDYPLTPVVGVWMQDWSGIWEFPDREGVVWNWEVDEHHYPGWDNFTSTNFKRGIRTLTYINPQLADVKGRVPPPSHNYYEEAKRQGVLVKTSDGVWNYSATPKSLIDLTSPGGVRFFKDLIINNMLARGQQGFMHDFGEALPLDALLADGSEAATTHSLYPLLWTRLTREAVEEAAFRGIIADADDIVFFSRAASAQSPGAASLMWLGDQLPSWDIHDGLKSAVVGLLSSGFSAFTLTHSDIGGYTDVVIPALHVNISRDKELLFRWCEFAAFTAVYRTHPGSQPSANWQVWSDAETMQHFSRFARLFEALAPYRERAMAELAVGVPVSRSLAFEYHTDPTAWTLTTQFLVGKDVLVAPVTDKGADSVRLYVPANTSWTSIWSDHKVSAGTTGQWFTVSAELGCPGDMLSLLHSPTHLRTCLFLATLHSCVARPCTLRVWSS